MIISDTGDIKILKALKKFTNNCIITKNKHRTGTDRIYEGAKRLKLNNDDYVINLQGDEPLISVKDINRLIKVTIRKKLKIGCLQVGDVLRMGTLFFLLVSYMSSIFFLLFFTCLDFLIVEIILFFLSSSLWQA